MSALRSGKRGTGTQGRKACTRTPAIAVKHACSPCMHHVCCDHKQAQVGKEDGTKSRPPTARWGSKLYERQEAEPSKAKEGLMQPAKALKVRMEYA